ncbi:MAG: tRNA uridine-5-carboxymethylaminomethyl(34) synthesis GTPase MnmE [Clostridia bacterium]|nr:tRNA uridine-5-carboxymethylaminomethyl(34) synthesis GTPase MnmE [Clostridia bacterium]
MKTIVAISTPAGNGGIGIVRMSGDSSLEILKKIFKPVKSGDFEPNVMRLGEIIDSEGNVVDQVLVSYFKAPKSYTGEDICEVNCHGGYIASKKVLELLLENGATPAAGGEFTKRAFLNGKMDLTQAEAVADLINSKTEKEGKASAAQLEGKLGRNIREIKDGIVDLLADIEADIDYPEYEDIEDVKNERIISTLDEQIEKLDKLEKSFESGKILKNGILTAIIGKPNVGKSSLMNVLLKEDRAIVTEIAGTTRDTIEEYVNLKGISLRLVDTAGIRDTEDIVENIGVEKSKKALNDAELVLFLVDGSKELSDEDKKLYEEIKTKNHIVIKNKIDLDEKELSLNDGNIVKISAKTGEGITELEDKIEELFNLKNLESENELIITNIRHKDLINKAKNGLIKANNTVKDGLPVDMISINIQEAIKDLCEILGESISDDVLNRIFEKFCVGK